MLGVPPAMGSVAAPSRPVVPLGLSLPPGLGQDAAFSSTGRFFVIRAAEQQPASNLGHFVHVVSGPHNGYNAAVASLIKTSDDQKRISSLDTAGSGPMPPIPGRRGFVCPRLRPAGSLPTALLGRLPMTYSDTQGISYPNVLLATPASSSR